MDRFIVVLITASSSAESARLSKALVKERLAACVNIVPGLRSVYRWKGRIESSAERLLIAKTRRSKLPQLIRRVRQLHSYSVPEIIALPMLAGHADYLRWIAASLVPEK
ncbi:MAG TPA: divalent-cation tolerance protein CutA [Elusimicrobiota bacterium]|nr:divalent-cation tolerance protein CutA [Elusimicrobiota bacterium]